MKLARSLFFLILLLCTALFGVYFALPIIVTRTLAPTIAENVPFDNATLIITGINLHQITGSITLGSESSPAIHVPRFSAHYNLQSIRSKKIDKIIIDSASLNIKQGAGELLIPGMRTTAGHPADEPEAQFPLLPFLCDEIAFENLRISLEKETGENHNLQINAALAPQFIASDAGFLFSGAFLSSTMTGDIQAAFSAHMVNENQQQLIEVHGEVSDLADLPRLHPELKNISSSGKADMSAKIDIGNFRDLLNYDASVTFSDARFQHGNLIFTSEPEKQLTFSVQGNSSTLHSVLKHGLMAGIFPTAVSLSADYIFATGNFTLTGQLMPEQLGGPVSIAASGKASGTATEVNYKFICDSVKTPQLSANGLVFEGNSSLENGQVNTSANAFAKEIFFQDQELILTGISAQIPLKLPLLSDPGQTPVVLYIERIRHQNMDLGKLQTELTLHQTGTDFSMHFRNAILPSMPMECTGSAQYSGDFSIACDTPQAQVDSQELPDTLRPDGDTRFTGLLAARLQFAVSDNIPSGSAKLIIRNGELTAGANIISGINVATTFPHLPLLESEPSQTCTIDSLTFGRISMKDGKIQFRVENPQTIFLENSRFTWCGGKVETGGLRLSSSTRTVQTTLYCDRLHLAELLAQFGLVDTEGQGSLNGRLPVLLSKDGIEIEDGFLFSTPGNSGIVHFNNTEQIRAGMPDMEQTAYLDYAVKALENFSYNWTKLTFNKDNDDLLVTLQLDGAPAAPLPFGYQNGNIIKTPQGPGIQHPIRLDVNFRFPVKDLFRYGKNVQSLMENMKK